MGTVSGTWLMLTSCIIRESRRISARMMALVSYRGIFLDEMGIQDRSKGIYLLFLDHFANELSLRRVSKREVVTRKYAIGLSCGAAWGTSQPRGNIVAACRWPRSFTSGRKRCSSFAPSRQGGEGYTEPAEYNTGRISLQATVREQ